MACLPRITSLRIFLFDQLEQRACRGQRLDRRGRDDVDRAIGAHASPLRRCACASAGPIVATTTSVATPFSRSRSASSSAMSSNGLADSLTPSGGDAGAVRLDLDAHVEIDHALVAHQNFHWSRFPAPVQKGTAILPRTRPAEQVAVGLPTSAAGLSGFWRYAQTVLFLRLTKSAIQAPAENAPAFRMANISFFRDLRAVHAPAGNCSCISAYPPSMAVKKGPRSGPKRGRQ
jgi:hypothetical protein